MCGRGPINTSLDLNIVFWNVTGLKSKFFGISHSSQQFLEYISKFKIIGLAETWATDKDSFILQGFAGFSAVRKQNPNAVKNSGGVLVFVCDELSSITKELPSSSSNVVWVLLQLTKRGLKHDFIIGTVYVSPEYSSIHSEEDIFNVLDNEICKFRDEHDFAKILLMGDFNGYTATQPDYLMDGSGKYDSFSDDNEPPEPRNRANKDVRNLNNYGKSVLNLCIAANLYIVNGRVGADKDGEYTCYFGDTPSTIDYLLADRDLFAFFKEFCVDIRDESHHMPLCLAASFPDKQHVDFHETNDTGSYLPRYRWDENKKESFLNTFYSKNIDKVTNYITNNLPENALQCLTQFIYESAEDMKNNRIKRGQGYGTRVATEPWFDTECFNLRRDNIRALRNYRKYRNQANLVFFKEGKKKLSMVYRKKKREYQAIQRDKLKVLLDINDSKVFWSTLKVMQKKKNTASSSITCQVWHDHFKTLLNPPNQNISEFRNIVQYNVAIEELDKEFSDKEIVKAIKELKSGKAPGIDGIASEFYKAIIPHSTTVIKEMFNKIYDLAHFPDMWSESLIIAIHKKGNLNEPGNYRGISLINVLSKAFTSILNNRIMDWLENNTILCKEQGGFRKKFSTIDSIFTLDTLIEKYVGKPRGRFYCAFVDFTKAFDSINREALWLKLQKVGISSKMLKMLMAIYNKVNASVLTQQGQSKTFSCPIGVKQGCILSPTLFSLFINDLSTFFADEGTYQIPLMNLELSSMLYADDLVLLSESAIGLQRQLNLLKSYCEKWQLKVNKDKTKIMVFRRGGALKRYEKWFYDGNKIDTDAHFSYLGVYFSSFHHWSQNQKFRATKGLRAMGSVGRILQSMPCISSDVVWKVFDSQILPILHYGSEIWGFSESLDIERVQLKCCKNILKIHTKVPGIALRGELGRLPLLLKRRYNIINYWLRILEMENTRLSKDAYKLQLNWAERDRKCWLNNVKGLLCNYGFAEVWFNQGIGDKHTFKMILKQRITDIGIQSWQIEINNMDRLRFYKIIKEQFCIEKYIDILEPLDRSVMANFRCTGLPLRVVVGVYYEKINYNSCLCEICYQEKTEDEYHFLLECKSLTPVRRKCISEYYWNPPSVNKYINLMSRNDSRGLLMIVKYLHEALKLRHEIKENRSMYIS